MRIFVLILTSAVSLAAQQLQFLHPAQLYLKGVVSTEASEIKITFSPDGSRVLWGSTNRPGGKGGWDIWEIFLKDGNWSAAQPAAFNSAQNDFDPFFSPDGRGVYFFSNRPGGLGGDDIWFAPFDLHTSRYDSCMNLGCAVNSSGNEWAPVTNTESNVLLFASDGRDGKGLHDLYTSRRQNGVWSSAAALPGAVNSPDADFDATFLHDDKTIVFTRQRKGQDGAELYVSFISNSIYEKATRLDSCVNMAGWNLGPAICISQPSRLYFTSHHPQNTAGRLDIYLIDYRVLPR
jgi:TolB protein